MPFDNPFFIRECRQARRRLHVAAWATGATWVTLLVFLVGMRFSSPSVRAALGFNSHAGAYGLVSLHLLLCLGAGALSGRVLSTEARGGTLPQLVLLPYTPGALLRLQLVYPLYWVLLSWLAGIPFYLVAVLLDVASMDVLSSLSPLPLAAGLLGMYELGNVSVHQRVRELASGAAKPKEVSAWPLLEALLPLWSLLACGFREVFSTRPGGWLVQLPFYGGVLPRWLFWAALSLLFCAAPVATAVSALTTEERSGAASRTAHGIIWLTYFLAVGYFWQMLPPTGRYALVLGVPLGLPLLVAFFRWAVPPRREDPLTPAELAWAVRWSDNPLYLRDLRTATRFVSLRRSLVRRGCVVFGFLGGSLALLLASALRPFLPWDELLLGTGLALTSFLFWFPPMQAVSAWSNEQPGGAVVLLLMTPLTSAELIVGRALAAIVYCWVVNASLWAVALATLAYALGRGYGLSLVPLLALTPLFLSLLTGSWSSDLATDSPTSTVARVLTECATGLGCFSLAIYARQVHPLHCVLVSLALFGANCWLARPDYTHALRTFDRFRRDELDALTRTNLVA